MSALVVGQKLFMPARNGRSECEFTVEKIGRKYAKLNGARNRCTIDGLTLDCGEYTWRKLYASKEAYEKEDSLNCAWRDLARHMGERRPAGATLEGIEQARALLMLGGVE